MTLPRPRGQDGDRAEADCRAWAAQHGLDVRQVHIDRGKSGYKDVARKGFDAATRAVISGAVGTLVVWKLDRLSRKETAEVGPLLAEFERIGGRLISVMDGLDSSSPGDRLAFASLSEWARTEAETQGERIRHAKQYLRGRGRWIGGRPPYGLRVDAGSGRLEPDPETAQYARLIADEALAGRPLVRIARLLNEYEIPAPRGGLWQVGSLSQLLRAPAFAGLLPQTEAVWDDERGCRRYTGLVRPYLDPETGRCPGARAMAAPVERAVVAALLARNPMLAGPWERSAIPERRALLSAAVERIWVTRAPGRGHRFDPEKRLRIVWVGDERRMEQRGDESGWLGAWQSAYVSERPN
ncbi:recombinase family protein [Streptomyces chartreusis]|uniref:recombinase family protein n=1 Tax=Streptomyces chartreusis TaxID=1969 RepID=UPI0035E3AB5B